MKLELSAKVFAVFVLASVLAAGLIAAEGSAVAQTTDISSSVATDTTGEISVSGGAGVAAVPLELPLGESDLVGSVMYRRSGEFERFDTDHDTDPPSGAGGASGASGSGGDREVGGSHYLLGDTFNVRVPASYAGKPAGVFAFSFNHVVLQAGSERFTAHCDNQRVFAYRDSGAARWRCDLDFGNSAPRWAEAAASASQVSIGAAWSDEGCKGDGAFGISKEELLLIADCKALLAVKHHWLDEFPENRDSEYGLKSKHALRSWGSGDIEDWKGVEVDGFHMTGAQFKANCDKDVKPKCPKRVVGVRLLVRDGGRIAGEIPEELGGVGNSGSSDCKEVVGPGLGFRFVGFAGVGCGLGALEVLDLRGNALYGGVPWQLGNLSAAPCNPSFGTPELDLGAAIALGLFVLGLLVSGGSLSLLALGVGIGVALFLDVNVSLGDHLLECLDAYGEPSHRVGSGGDGVSFDRTRLPDRHDDAEVAGRQEDGSVEFAHVLLGLEVAGEFVDDLPDAEGLGIRVRNVVRRGKAGVRIAGEAAGYVSAILDAKDIVSGLLKSEEREFLHLDRSQLWYLNLAGNELSGHVPAEIGNLDSLEYLYLNLNNLSGSIPGNAGRGGRPAHDKLVLFNASNNSFEGGVPPLLSTRLEVIDFSDNKLGGFVPSSLVLSLGLRYLDLSSNRLSGELPASIANLEHLEVLRLNNNSLSGMVPSEIGKRHKTNCRFLGFFCDHRIATGRLQHVDLSDNLFHGEIPENLGNIPDLSLLDLEYNCFDGDVPDKLLDKSRDENFDLKYDYNMLDSSSSLTTAACSPCFDGTYLPDDADEDLKMDCVVLLGLKNHWGRDSFPYRWGEAGYEKMSSWPGVVLKNPDDLSDEENRVTGLKLANLGLSGTVPESLTELRKLTFLRLEGNQLTGGIPASLSELSDLETLNLSNNMLSGEIPDNVGGGSYYGVPSLTDLDLSHNMLSGEIPVGIGHRLTSIVNLDLSHNRLTGPIPGLLSEDPDSVWNVNNNDIYGGSIAIANLRKLKVMDLSHNLLSGEIPDNIPISSHLYKDFIGYGGHLETLLFNNNCLTLDADTIKQIREAEIFIKVENNPSEARCVGGCSGGVLVDNPSSNDGLVADCEVLLELSEHWSGSAAVELWSKGTRKNITSWQGVTVSDGGRGRVVGLELPGEGITGDIPQRIGGLAHLQILDLSDNELTGEIPASLRYLSNLQNLDLSDNALTEGIPSSLKHLASLQILDLSGNRLSGRIPGGFGNLASLRVLDLRKNQLTGRIPPSLGRLSGLTSLKLQKNKLTGAIPEELADISGFYGSRAVNLSMNCLLGPIPAGLAGIAVAGGNLFGTSSDNPICGDPCSNGTFVSSETQESQDQESRVVVASPLVDDCRVLWAVRKRWHSAGPAVVASPQKWGTVAYLDIATWPGVTVSQGRVKELRLAAAAGALPNKRLRGTVPAVLANLTALEVLNLKGHRLWGEIPEELDRLANLKKLNLSNNRLWGPVPASFSGLTSLVTLNLSHNRLSGQIPSLTATSSGSDIPVIVRPPRLERLLLNDNEFGGIIPPQITYHTNLKKLRLGNNNLHGPIPASIDLLTRLTDLRLNDNNLTGPAPEGLERLTSLRYLHFQNNCLTGQDPGYTLTSAIVAAYLAAQAAYLSQFTTVPEILLISPDVRTGNNLFYDAATENKICARICYDSVFDPENNRELVQDCEALLAVRDKWAAQTILPEGQDSAMSTWGGTGDRKRFINTWQGVTLKNNRIAGLDLSGHALTSPVPPQLANLTALTSLNFADNDLSDFPAPALELDQLLNLDLSSNRITTLPANISRLTALTSLNLADNDITSFPAPVQELKKLQELYLSNNRLTALPASIDKLTGLTSLDLSNNRLTALPASIDKLIALSSLDLSNNRLTALPASTNNLNSLTSLNLESNRITSLPFTAASLAELVYLNAAGNALTAIPDAISNMTNLQTLDLSENNIQSPVTNLIRNLTRLTHLNLSNNKFTGQIPSEIGNLRSLIYLDLSNNGLRGDILAQIGNLHNLKHLNLSNIWLTGPMPSAIGNLRNLEYLNLSNTFSPVTMSGTIPPEIGNLRNLEHLNLSSNYLSGSVPKEIGNLGSLEHLDLSVNLDLTGPIPTAIGNLRNLKHMDLSFTSLFITPAIGNLQNLEHLDISEHNDQPNGTIPPEIGNLRNLKYLDAFNGYLSGPIPKEIGNLQNLEYMDMSLNGLSGPVPPEIGNLHNLKYLNLYVSGSLSGPIPPEIGNLHNLEHLELELDLYPGSMSGPIPSEIGNLRNLKFLNILANLSGAIPPEIGNLQNLEYLSLSHFGDMSDSNGLSGPIPSEIGSLRNLEYLYLSNNDLCGAIPTITSRRIRRFDYSGNPRLGSPCP